jgi:hypothetical protein
MLEIGCLRQLHIPLSFILWCCLLVLCWPLALFAIIMLAVVWLLALPFRIYLGGSDRIAGLYACGAFSALPNLGIRNINGKR